MATQNSIISYVPQPFYKAGSCTIVDNVAVASIENAAGIFDPDLSNYTTVIPDMSAGSFTVKIDFPKQSGHLADFDLTLALVGCALLTYENDGGDPDLDTEFSENIDCIMSCNIGTVADELTSFAHNSQDTIHTFNRLARPSVISGGRANLLFNGLGVFAAGTTGTVYVTITRATADVTARPHARLILGHLFVGVDLLVQIDPVSFSWTLEIENQRFVARDFGDISSDGTLVKRSSGEVIRIANDALIGSIVTAVGPVATSPVPNFFDLVKVNTSYPLLFNPYPVQTVVADTSLTVERVNLTARQNFFSIYGFMSDPLELLTGEFRDGLQSEYRVRYRLIETR